MSSLTDRRNGQGYWRSLAEHADTPEFRERCRDEFPGAAAETPDPFSRRGFLKLMGASVALAGMAGCRWPRENIVPHAHRPEGVVPGKARRFASTIEIGGVAQGLLVTSSDGRPIKIEGNPLHPVGGGAADAMAQASILELYDPDRSRHPVEIESGVEARRSMADFEAWAAPHFADLAAREGAGLFVLSEASSSLGLAEQRRRFLAAYPSARWHVYEPLGRENALAGSRLASGRALRSRYELAEARVILSLDADPLAGHPAAIKHARDFAQGRDPDGPMNRLYAVEGRYTLTGAMADHRYVLPPSRVEAFALSIAAKIVQALERRLPGEYSPLAAALAPHRGHDFDADLVEALVSDLLHEPGRSAIFVGDGQPPRVHALALLLHKLLGDLGRTVLPCEEPGAEAAPGGEGSLQDLSAAMAAGRVETLVILGGNPAYDAPAALDFEALLAKVPGTVHLGLSRNETSRACRWHLPRAHYLESWGDTLAWDGTLCAVQPLIEPLYGGRSAVEFVAFLADGRARGGHELTREALAGRIGSVDFERGWRRFLHDGVLAGSALPTIDVALDLPALSAAIADHSALATGGGLELEFVRDASVHDGRFANNGWLQELPDPLTKLTWDNAALIAIETAAEHGIDTGDLLHLELDGREMEAAAYLMPGQAPGLVTLTLGYGRRASGGIGDGVGFDAYRLRTSAHPHFASGLKIEKTGRRYEFAATQDHHLIDRVGYEGRADRLDELLHEGSLAEYRRDPHSVHGHGHHPPLVSLWKEHAYEGHRWGMSIDLNTCIGCGACATACQAENNIPVVGKREVARGREMSWIRLDRYFQGDPAEPEAAFQPVACTHCELAPCEQVCPVAATTHSSEGLNDMVYNRCIGTRYCSNNCPYKVRRFNYFNYTKGVEEVEKLAYNPQVTVRSRGVMEKCSYCVQRIQTVKIQAKNESRAIADGEVVPACAQTCPTRAITFGDLNDESSAVRASHGDGRSYALLAELNIKPRTAYLARIRNPNPHLLEADEHGHRDH